MSAPRTPREWRERAGMTLAAVAARVGIHGNNPARTFGRYETGERPTPPAVIEAVRILSGQAIGAEAFHDARRAWLNQRKQTQRVA